MKNRFAPLWVSAAGILLALAFAAPQAAAQDDGMDFSLDEADSSGGDTGGDTGGDAGGDGMDFSLDDASGDGTDTGDGADGSGDSGGGDVIGDLAGDTGETEGEQREAAPREEESVEEVYAIQRIYALRLNRVELAPFAAFTMNDPYVSHPGVGLALNYWFTNVLAVGANFVWYQFGDISLRESDTNFFVRRSTRLGIPITEWQLGAYLNFTYVPFYGKFAVFNKLIFQWDAYVVGGVGLMRSRPVPVIDPEYRTFDFSNQVGFNLGLGLRIFVTRFLGVFLEYRNYLYLERFENLEVSPFTANDDAGNPLPGSRLDPDTWEADSATLTNNASIQFGLTIFFPFTFEYELPK